MCSNPLIYDIIAHISVAVKAALEDRGRERVTEGRVAQGRECNRVIGTRKKYKVTIHKGFNTWYLR